MAIYGAFVGEDDIIVSAVEWPETGGPLPPGYGTISREQYQYILENDGCSFVNDQVVPPTPVSPSLDQLRDKYTGLIHGTRTNYQSQVVNAKGTTPEVMEVYARNRTAATNVLAGNGSLGLYDGITSQQWCDEKTADLGFPSVIAFCTYVIEQNNLTIHRGNGVERVYNQAKRQLGIATTEATMAAIAATAEVESAKMLAAADKAAVDAIVAAIVWP